MQCAIIQYSLEINNSNSGYFDVKKVDGTYQYAIYCNIRIVLIM